MLKPCKVNLHPNPKQDKNKSGTKLHKIKITNNFTRLLMNLCVDALPDQLIKLRK